MILKDNLLDTSEVGLLATCNEDICLVGKFLKEQFYEEIERALEVEVLRTTLFGTNLVGLFGLLTKDILYLPKSPDYTTEEEKFLKGLKERGIEVVFLETKHNAIPNIAIIYNDKALLSFEVRKEKAIIEEFKNTFEEVEFLRVREVDSVGQLVVIKEGYAFASNLLDEENLEFLREYFNLKGITVGTVNFGSPFVRSGLLINSKGLLAGKKCTGVEMMNILEAFPFLKKQVSKKEG